jgi:hypothetical protein
MKWWARATSQRRPVRAPARANAARRLAGAPAPHRPGRPRRAGTRAEPKRGRGRARRPRLRSIFTGKKRTSHASPSTSCGHEDTTADLTGPECSDDSYSSRPKRRAMSVDAARVSTSGLDKRGSLEQWHEARRARWGQQARA